jgi:hypothetical protein
MELPEQRVRLVAATPIEVEDRRLLPSVLVSTLHTSRPQRGAGVMMGRAVRLRPVSIVVEGSESAEWIEIPNTTADTLNSMVAAAATISLVSLFIIIASRLLRSGSA